MAQTAIDDQTDGCIMFVVPGISPNAAPDYFTKSASFNGTQLSASSTLGATPDPDLFQLSLNHYFSVSLKAGATLSASYSMTTDGSGTFCALALYDCSGVFIEQDFLTTASGTVTVTAPEDGVYIISLYYETSSATAITTTATLTSSDVFWVNPVIALWDDSGTTRKLWACPKMLMPPLTESTGDWYADCAEANAILTDPLQVSNCEGYFDATDGPVDTFDFSGSTFTAFVVSPISAFGRCWASFSVPAGSTITFTASTDGGTPDVFAVIYDDAGNVFESLGSGGGGAIVTSSAVPYPGRYTVVCYCSVPPPGSPFSEVHIAVSFSVIGATVNPIQARYDLGLTCAGTLDCGDACP